MKIIYPISTLIIILLTYLFYQRRDTSSIKLENNDTNFSLSITTYNHDEMIFTGETTYKFSNDSLTISLHTIFSEIDSVIFSKRIENNLVEQLTTMKLDTLQNIYFNNCVMGTSGAEYHIAIKKDTISKNIWLHHYYHRQIEQLLVNINSIIPNEYQINYIPSDTKQSCD